VLGITLRGLSPSDVLSQRGPVSGAAYYLSLLRIVFMPWLLVRLRKNHE